MNWDTAVVLVAVVIGLTICSREEMSYDKYKVCIETTKNAKDCGEQP